MFFYLTLFVSYLIFLIFSKMLDKESKRRIFTDLLKQAPPGEFNAVFDDIRTMHHDAQILDEQCATTLVEYNHENFLPVTHPELQEVCYF